MSQGLCTEAGEPLERYPIKYSGLGDRRGDIPPQIRPKEVEEISGQIKLSGQIVRRDQLSAQLGRLVGGFASRCRGPVKIRPSLTKNADVYIRECICMTRVGL